MLIINVAFFFFKKKKKTNFNQHVADVILFPFDRANLKLLNSFKQFERMLNPTKMTLASFQPF